MADETAPPTEEASATETTEEIPGAEALADPGKQALDRMKAERDEARRLAKAHEKELAEFRKSSMTESERIAAEAEERGALRVRTEYGQRLAQTEFRAAAAARNPGYDVGKALKYVNLSGLLGEDGEPDVKAITAAVADLVPEATGTTAPSFDGGSRQAAPAGADFNQLIRQASGRT